MYLLLRNEKKSPTQNHMEKIVEKPPSQTSTHQPLSRRQSHNVNVEDIIAQQVRERKMSNGIFIGFSILSNWYRFKCLHRCNRNERKTSTHFLSTLLLDIFFFSSLFPFFSFPAEFSCTFHNDIWTWPRRANREHNTSHHKRFKYLVFGSNSSISCINRTIIQYYWFESVEWRASGNQCGRRIEANASRTLHANLQWTEKCDRRCSID